MALWETFESRLVITGRLRAVTALRVGVGRGEGAQPSASDLPVLLSADARPFIPGSSLRGVVRAYVERVVRTVEPWQPTPTTPYREGRGACNPLNEQEWCIAKPKMDELKEDYKKLKDFARPDEWLARQIQNRICRVCQSFGSPWLASRIRISDLPFASDSPPRIERRDGVAIDRDTETVQQKYDFEVVPGGSAFQLHVVAENLTVEERGLLWLGLRELRDGGLSVGGFKGRGLGQVVVEDLAVMALREGDRAALKQYLLRGTLSRMDEAEADGWLESLWEKMER